MKKFTMANVFHMTFISNVSDPLYDDLNKTWGFMKKISPIIDFKGKFDVVLVDCILKNT